jgi:hypothetical protein
VTPEQEAILAEVLAERDRQDEQWGGPKHDDDHIEQDWFAFIGNQIDKAERESFRLYAESTPRDRLIKIAALALAGIESIDRNAAVIARENAEAEK